MWCQYELCGLLSEDDPGVEHQDYFFHMNECMMTPTHRSPSELAGRPGATLCYYSHTLPADRSGGYTAEVTAPKTDYMRVSPPLSRKRRP